MDEDKSAGENGTVEETGLGAAGEYGGGASATGRRRVGVVAPEKGFVMSRALRAAAIGDDGVLLRVDFLELNRRMMLSMVLAGRWFREWKESRGSKIGFSIL